MKKNKNIASTEHTVFWQGASSFHFSFKEIPYRPYKFSVKKVFADNPLSINDIGCRLNFTFGNVTNSSTVNGKVGPHHVLLVNNNGLFINYERTVEDDITESAGEPMPDVTLWFTQLDGTRVVVNPNFRCVVVITVYHKCS